MTKKLHFIFFFLVLGCVISFGQDAPEEVTVEADQSEQWRLGLHNYPPKPKHAWELGLHVGSFFIGGDVDAKNIPSGYGIGLHLRRAINYTFSIRGDFFYGHAKGLENQPWKTGPDGGGLVESLENGAYSLYNGTQGWFPSYKTRYIYGAMQAVFNVGNVLFHKEKNIWNFYIALGAGFDNHVAKLDLLDASGMPYLDLVTRTGFDTTNDFDTKEGRDAIERELENIYDGDYETEGFKQKGIFRLGDETNIHVVLTGSVGVSRKINKRFNIGLEHQVMYTDNDYLDGIRFRHPTVQTSNNDVGHYTNLRFAINLGNLDTTTEPLYWLNPIDPVMNDIAELKRRPALDLTDSDGDGVIDMLDQELDTPAGAPVDTRGITLDSDDDGVPDYRDKEPYSPPGYPVDEDGVSQIPRVTPEDVDRIVENNNSKIMTTINSMKAECGEWFLPMIHFDLDKHNIKQEFYGHLHHVADVLQICPEICITVTGHTDSRHTNEYNSDLSYKRAEAVINYLVEKYGIDRSRLKLMYGGEESLLIDQEGTYAHYMNRRVEFRVCDANATDMEKPGESGNSPEGGNNQGSGGY